MAIDPFLVGFAFSLGVGTFFSPCSVALLPAYVGWFAGLGPDAERLALRVQATKGLRFGIAAAVGILAVFAVFAAAIWWLRTRIGISSGDLGIGLSALAVAVGVVVIALGVLMILGRGPSFTPRIKAPQQKSVGAMVLFGGLYAFASLGCTLPLFFAVLSQVLLVGPVAGTVLLAAFAVGFAGLMFVVTITLSVAQDRARRVLAKTMPYIKPVSGALLVAAGGYVLWYYLVKAPPI